MNPHHLFRIILMAILLSVIVFPLEIQADPLPDSADPQAHASNPISKRPPGYWHPPYRMRRIKAVGISPELVEKIITIRYLYDMTQCFETAGAEDPGLQVRLKLRLILKNSGKVAQARVIQSSMPNEKLEICLTEAALHWTFESWILQPLKDNPEAAASAEIRLEYPR